MVSKDIGLDLMYLAYFDEKKIIYETNQNKDL